VISALPQLSQVNPDVSSGVAVWAHVGGFITGMILIKLFEKRSLVAERNAVRRSQALWPGARP
jgi:membrane associated rhomboid family serine protease